MPDIFSIQAAESRVTLDAEGRGAAQFTVTNKTEDELRAAVRVLPLGPSGTPEGTPKPEAAWLEVEGDTERAFLAGQSQDYSVKIAAPVGTTPGDYQFALQCASLRNPDREKTTGEPVGFRVEKKAEPKPETSPGPWKWIAIAAAVVLVLVGAGVGIVIALRPSKVPDLTRMTLDDATAALTGVGLALGSSDETVLDRAFEGGTITSQDPPAGAKIEDGLATVDVVLADAGIVVPEVVGMTLERAREAAGDDFTIAELPQRVRDKPPLTVLAQRPPAGEFVRTGTALELDVVADSREVPALTGKELAEARGMLTVLNLGLEVSTRITNQRPANTVLEQNPAAGALVDPASNVLLTVATPVPDVTVPNLMGQPIDRALESLKAIGLRVGRRSQQVTSRFGPGTVAEQSPRGGSRIPPGSSVDLVEAAPLPRRGTSAFMWGNNQTASQYSPLKTYVVNPSGAVSARRVGVGRYAVTFAGLGGQGTAGGHVQVSAYGGSNRYCNVASWNSSASDFVVNVRCFDAGGRPADSLYTTYVTWPTPGVKEGFAWADRATTAKYTPSAAYAHTSSRGSVQIARSAVGRYQVVFPGIGGGSTAGGTVQVSGYGGGNQRCKVVSWASSGVNFTSNVACFDAAGKPADSRFAIRAFWPSSRGEAYAWANNATTATYAPNASYASNPGRGPIEIQRKGQGSYTVLFKGLKLSGGNVQVTSYGSDPSYCGVASWGGGSAGLGVNVRCYDAAGRPADARYVVQVSKQ